MCDEGAGMVARFFFFINIHADISIGARGLNHSVSVHPHSDFVYAINEGFAECAHLHILT